MALMLSPLQYADATVPDVLLLPHANPGRWHGHKRYTSVNASFNGYFLS
jgi:hypothetical protein